MLRIESLEKKFICHALNQKEIVGFSPISFHVPPGKALGLSGPSGQGKSSVLKCIYRTYGASAGHIYYESAEFGAIDLGTALENEIIRLRGSELAYVTQFLSVLPRVGALDVVADPLLTMGTPLAEARSKAAELLARLRIDRRLHDAYPATFSGGEKQRVNLARAIIRPSRLLLLDEPTASLDKESVEVVIELLTEMKKKGTTLIGVFHDRSIMDRLMDQIYVMPEKESIQ
jgi:alpha-D-ribose 1-methylphosphonate 5-triphosphate synthase subunit PhnL